VRGRKDFGGASKELRKKSIENYFQYYKTLHEEGKKTVSTCTGPQHSYIPEFNCVYSFRAELLHSLRKVGLMPTSCHPESDRLVMQSVLPKHHICQRDQSRYNIADKPFMKQLSGPDRDPTSIVLSLRPTDGQLLPRYFQLLVSTTIISLVR
jgi:hypothetical protein